MWKALKSTLKPYSPKHSSELKRWNPCLHRGETAWKYVPKFINLCSKFIKKRKAGTEKASPGGTGRVLRTGSPREKVIWHLGLTLEGRREESAWDANGTGSGKALRWEQARFSWRTTRSQRLEQSEDSGGKRCRCRARSCRPSAAHCKDSGSKSSNSQQNNECRSQSQLRGLFETHVWHSASPIAELPNWAT